MATKNKNYLNNINNQEKHFTASALIINEEGKILLINHKKLGVWLYPGGHVKINEEPDTAIIREVKEETGLSVEIISDKDGNLADPEADVSVLHHPYVILCEKILGDNEYHYHIDMVYLCRINAKRTQLINNKRESAGINFFGLDDLDQISLFPNFRKLLEKILNAKTK